MVNIKIDPKMKAAIQKIAEKQFISKSALIKQAVEKKVKKQEMQLKSLPKDTDNALKKQEEQKLAEARKLLEEATEFENKAAKDLQKTQKQIETLNKELTKKEDQRRDFIKGLNKK